MRRLSGVFSVAITLLFAGVSTSARTEDLQRAAYAVSVQYDVVYGSGIVGASSSKPHARDLRMDVYRPMAGGKPLTGRPAVILAFGGGLHRGSKGQDRYEEDGASDTPMGEYCRAFAAAGYVCSSIEYRLVPEDPAPSGNVDMTKMLPKAMLVEPGITVRINQVRGWMGLPPLDDASREQLFNTMITAAEDFETAVTFVRTNAEKLGVDPQRVALGGFSAGGSAAINAAYGKGVPVQAVFSLSGPMGGYDLRKTVRPGMPPFLLVVGQTDLEGVRASAPKVLTLLEKAGIENEGVWVPGFGHFYPMGATTLGTDFSKQTLERRLLMFLERTIGRPRS